MLPVRYPFRKSKIKNLCCLKSWTFFQEILRPFLELCYFSRSVGRFFNEESEFISTKILQVLGHQNLGIRDILMMYSKIRTGIGISRWNLLVTNRAGTSVLWKWRNVVEEYGTVSFNIYFFRADTCTGPWCPGPACTIPPPSWTRTPSTSASERAGSSSPSTCLPSSTTCTGKQKLQSVVRSRVAYTHHFNADTDPAPL